MLTLLTALVPYALVVTVIATVVYAQGSKWWKNIIGRALVLDGFVLSLILANGTLSQLDPSLGGRLTRTAITFVFVCVGLTYRMIAFIKVRRLATKLRRKHDAT